MSEPGTYPVFSYQTEFTDGSVGWVAEHPDLPGVTGVGYTLSEARASLTTSRAAYLRLMDRLGREVPPPPSDVPSSETREIVPDDEEGPEERMVQGGAWALQAEGRWRPPWGRRAHPRPELVPPA